jgi:hypothetical protein
VTTHYQDYKVDDLVVATSENSQYPKGQMGIVTAFHYSYPVIKFDANKLASVFDFDEIEPYEGDGSFFDEGEDVGETLIESLQEAVDMVNSPSHYSSGGIECIDYLKDNMPYEAYLGYLEGNLKKYLHRWRHKGKPMEDLHKSRWYLNRLIQELGGED